MFSVAYVDENLRRLFKPIVPGVWAESSLQLSSFHKLLSICEYHKLTWSGSLFSSVFPRLPSPDMDGTVQWTGPHSTPDFSPPWPAVSPSHIYVSKYTLVTSTQTFNTFKNTSASRKKQPSDVSTYETPVPLTNYISWESLDYSR